MEKPVPTPKACLLIKDKAYAYCTCNKSLELPFCDGNHKKLKEDFKPLLFKVPKKHESIFMHLRKQQKCTLLRRIALKKGDITIGKIVPYP